MPNKELDHNFIKGLKAPDKPVEFYDDLETGLMLRVSKAGTKTFCYRYRFNGKKRRYTIGQFPAIGLAKARNQVKRLKVKVLDGIDPQAEREARKKKTEPNTVNDLAKEFKKRHFPKLKESTQKTYRSRIDSEILPAFGSTRIEDVNRRDIISFLEEIVYEEGKHVHANRVRNVFSRMFSFGVEKGIAEYNPVSTVKPVGEEKSRERVYGDVEIKSLWDAFDQQAEPVQSVLKMLLICGQRKGETSQMKWENIKEGEWKIPKEVTKNKRTHYVPLSGLALDVLEKLKPLTGDSEYVFNSNRREGPIRWLGSVSERIQDLSGVNDFRIHDLRRTAASNMAKLGIERTVLGKVLNHKGLAGDSQVTAIYDRYEYMEEKQQALQRWSAKLQKIIEGKQANITELKTG